MPWIAAAAGEGETDDAQLSTGQVATICAEAAAAASDVLYELSGRQFTGECGPVTVRPLSRPTDGDTRAWAGGFGYMSSWGYCSTYGATPGVAAHYGSLNPPEIDLGVYPVTEITLVTIDGVTIPADEYELRDYRVLVRMRPNATFTPTERWGWPTGQIQDLPDSEVGTFAVTYMYGQPPPASGLRAVKKLAEYLVLPDLGDDTHYPARIESMTRQGVSTRTTDVLDFVKTGGTGIVEVDLFLQTVNPQKLQRQARVWSPDRGRARRTPTSAG